MKIIFISILLTVLLLFSIPTAYSQTTKLVILSSEDSSVDQDSPDTPKLPTTNTKYENTTYGDWIFLSSGTTNTAKWDGDYTVINKSYIKFDISNVPENNVFNIVNIDAELRLLVQEIDADSDRTLITIHSVKIVHGVKTISYGIIVHVKNQENLLQKTLF